jgi:hypothetical protein
LLLLEEPGMPDQWLPAFAGMTGGKDGISRATDDNSHDLALDQRD